MSERTPDGLAFEVAGAGAPVLFIHAGIADRTMWDPQWRVWSDANTVVRYDQRGFGDSSDPAGSFALHQDALAVLDASGIERASIVGASMGGRAALDLALVQPERVSALILVASTPSGWKHRADLLAAFAAVEGAYEGGGIEAANELELRIWVDGPKRAPGEVEPRFREHVAHMNLSALAREEARELADANPEPDELDPPALRRLGELRIPVLVVTGELDQPSVNAGSAAIAAAVDGATAIEIAAAAHLPSLERPGEFDRVALAFLRG